jgi:hypothetical protein
MMKWATQILSASTARYLGLPSPTSERMIRPRLNAMAAER